MQIINIPPPKINNYNMRGTTGERMNVLRLNLLAGKNIKRKKTENTELSSETMETPFSAM